MIGALIVDEQVLPIRQLVLHDGILDFRVTFPTPPAFERGDLVDVRVHGEDGSLILATRIAWPLDREAEPGVPWDVVHFHLPVHLEGSRPGEPWATQLDALHLGGG